MINRTALYKRVSTTEQSINGHSLEEQEDRMTKYCEAKDWKIIKVYSDAGFSGANTNRPALQQLIRDVKSHIIDRVLVYKLDRLSRSQKDTLMLIDDIFLTNGCDFVSMTENFDTASPFGRAMIGILSVFAQLEREQIKERMQMGKLARAKKGKFHGSVRVPIGYDYKDGDLITNDYEKMQVIRIFNEFLAGVPVNRIVRELNEEGYTTKYGKWCTSTAREILTHKTYIGLLPYKGNDYRGNHEAFITDEMYDNVQTMLHRRNEALKMRGIRYGKATSALGGILVCKCGKKMGKSTVRKYKYYACRNGKCDQSVWKMSEMDELVFSEIRKLALERPKTAPKIEGEENIDRKIIEGKLGEINRKIDRIIDLFALDEAPKETIQEKLSDLNHQKEALTRQLDAIEDVKPISPDEVIDLAASLDRVLRSEDVDEIRALITALIDKIEVNGENITIFWSFY